MTVEAGARTLRWRWTVMILLTYGLAVAVRSVFLWEVRKDPVYLSMGHDEAVNDQVARAILSHQMPEESFYKAPLYMYSLAGIYRVLGEDPAKARWVQVFIDGLSPVLLALIGQRLFGWLVGAISGLIGTSFWSFVFYSAELVDTSLACTLYLLLAYLMLALPEGRWWKWFLCGIVLGLGAITRPNILAFAPVLAVVVFVITWRRSEEKGADLHIDRLSSQERDWRSQHPAAFPTHGIRGSSQSSRGHRAFSSVIALAVGCCAAVSPVTLHNRFVGGEWVPIATYGGLNFYVANGPYSDGKNGPLLVSDGVPDASILDPNSLWSRLDLNYRIAQSHAQNRLGRSARMGEVDQLFSNQTLQYIQSEPVRFLGNCLKRFCWFFNRYEFANVKDPYRLCRVSPFFEGLSWFHYGILCPMAVLGLILALKARGMVPGEAYYLTMLASLFLPGLFFVMNSRYRLPTVYVLAPFAAYGLVRFVGLWRKPTNWLTRIGACTVLTGVGLVSNLDLYGYAATHHTELLMTYAQGCLKTHDNDLLAEAAPRFERAYWSEMAAGGRPWASTLHHFSPMTWLFAFYYRLNDIPKAMRYGTLMTEQEPLTPPAFLAYFDLLLKQNRREDAGKLLDMLESKYLTMLPDVAIESFLSFWARFQDESVLVRVERMLSGLVQQRPKDDYLSGRLSDVRHLLQTVSTSSRASVSRSASSGTTRPSDQEAPR